MSLTDTMYIGTSGLTAHGDALGIVGDNIANASTVGYKRDRAEFSDLLGGQIDGLQLGGGVKLDAPETMFDQGSITQTGNPLDVAIQGNGFFVVKGTHDGVTNDFYTRDGQFQLDNAGYVVDGNGLRLQGFNVTNGVRSPTMDDLQLGGRTTPAVATTSSKVTLNLNADDNATAAAPFDPANPSTTSQYATSETVYDSLGNAHAVELYFHADGNGQWDYHAMVDGGDLTGGTKGTPTEIASGTLQFGTNGVFTSQTSNGSSASFVGATPNQAIDFDFSPSTQTAAPESSVTSLDVDGNAAGTLTDIQISTDGKVTGTFSNGQDIQLAQLGLATFQSNNGLKRDSDNLFDATPDSGQAAIDAVGQGGRGSVSQGALEQSNVDLSTELVTMIAYQRAFEANSKTVTTADQMMQTVSQL